MNLVFKTLETAGRPLMWVAFSFMENAITCEWWRCHMWVGEGGRGGYE